MNYYCPICSKKNNILFCSIDHSVASDGSGINRFLSAYLCKECVSVFKIRNPEDQKTIEQIYNTYILHSLDGNHEQKVAYDKYTDGVEKTFYILEYLEKEWVLPNQGRLLDVGCHFGAFIKNFVHKYPKWQCYGYDVSDRFKPFIEAINNSQYFSGRLNAINGKFDLIILTHVMEHLETPLHSLKCIREMLSDRGVLLIAANNLLLNPFLPLIFEQHFNFSPQGLFKILEKCGFYVEVASTSWIPKECMIIARKNCRASRTDGHRIEIVEKALDDHANSVNTLMENRDLFKSIVSNISSFPRFLGPIGILGTSYVARWISKQMNIKCDFFLDEDVQMQGKVIDGISVVDLYSVPENANILLPFNSRLANKIKNRLQVKRSNINFVLPPLKITEH